MSDPRIPPTTPTVSLEPEASDASDRLSAILADGTLPDRDKRQAIQEALEDLQRERGEEPAASYEPLETRFFEALSLLAEGGHDYGEAAGSDEPTAPGDLENHPSPRI